MAGTIRYFDSAVHALVLKRLQDVIAGTGAAMGCETKFEVNELTPAVINHPEMMRLVVEAALNAAPDLEINENYQRMGSEDMASLLERVPGCFFFVGSANAERGLNYPHHHPKFDIDESVLPTAVCLDECGCIKPGRTLQEQMSFLKDISGLTEFPRRIVSLIPSVTDSLFAHGLGESVVGVTDYCQPPALAAGG